MDSTPPVHVHAHLLTSNWGMNGAGARIADCNCKLEV